ncbi:hypothetical protein, partial [Erythrobacter donghaensis]|uniref:hypothetical protein n=1 Tax=Erythrobacter donghaensis TaxID=267135 RepID=UPI001E60DFD9
TPKPLEPRAAAVNPVKRKRMHISLISIASKKPKVQFNITHVAQTIRIRNKRDLRSSILHRQMGRAHVRAP